MEGATEFAKPLEKKTIRKLPKAKTDNTVSRLIVAIVCADVSQLLYVLTLSIRAQLLVICLKGMWQLAQVF